MRRPARASPPFDLSQARVSVVLNRAAGGVDGRAEAVLRDIFEAAKIPHAPIVCADRSDLREKLEGALDDSDVLVLLAGDGTISAAANLCGERGTMLVPLPGGTMNVLSRALYGHVPWAEVLRRVLSASTPQILSGGRAGGRLFLVSAILGVPSRWTEARESLRSRHLAAGLRQITDALGRPFPENLHYRFGSGASGYARAVAVRCPVASRVLDADAPTLEAAAIDPKSAAQAVGLGVNALFGRWRDDPQIKVALATDILVDRPGGVPAILDGESTTLPDKTHVAFEPGALSVLVPA